MPKRKRTSFLFVNKFKSFAVPCNGLLACRTGKTNGLNSFRNMH